VIFSSFSTLHAAKIPLRRRQMQERIHLAAHFNWRRPVAKLQQLVAALRYKVMFQQAQGWGPMTITSGLKPIDPAEQAAQLLFRRINRF
jgi:hypothetical protein